MTLKELFKKVETYNEIAEMMKSRKAKIHFYVKASGCNICFGESFDSFESLRKYVRREYLKQMADAVLKCSDWELDNESEIAWSDYFGEHVDTFGVDLVAD